MNLTRQQQSHRDFWADVILTAETMDEPFQEVRIVTLRSHFLECVYEQALSAYPRVTESELSYIAKEMLEARPITVAEHVTFSPDGSITVVIDRDIIDETATFDAMEMILKAVRAGGTHVTLGLPVSFAKDVVSS